MSSLPAFLSNLTDAIVQTIADVKNKVAATALMALVLILLSFSFQKSKLLKAININPMEETAYFLNLVVHSDKPVVLVGAMRPSTAISADGPLNLYNAVITASAKESKGKGVMVVMNGLILGAGDVLKTNTISVETFQSPNCGPLGYVFNSKVFFNRVSVKKHTTNSEFSVDNLNKLPKVGIIYSYSNVEPEVVNALIASGYKGIIHVHTCG